MEAARLDYWLRWDRGMLALSPGTTVTFGRSRSRTVQLAPDDLLISGHAGEVRTYGDHLQIINTSTTREFLLRPPLGEDRIVLSGTGTTSHGLRRFAIVLPGSWGAQYVIEVCGPAGPPDFLVTGTAVPTVPPAIRLSATELSVMVLLSRPLVTRNGAAAVPATYGAIAEALGRSPNYVRKVVGEIRRKLTAVGVPGLDGTEQGSVDYRLPLARYAVSVGWAFSENLR